MATIEDAPEGMLRAWADAGVISSARYIEEIERRNGRIVIKSAPPLDYALEQELAADVDIPDLDRIEAMFDDAVPAGPAPPAVKWLALAAATLIIIALWMVLPWKG